MTPAVPGINEVHEGDCIQLMRSLPDASAQLVIADPPYNIGPRFGVAKEWLHDPSWLNWCSEWLWECRRVMTEDGNLFVYGIHHYLCLLQVRLYEMGMTYRRQIIWHYENGFTTYRRNLAAHYEPILWFSKEPNSYFREIREPYKSTDRLRHKITKNGKEWTPHPDGRLAGDVWTFPTLAGRRFRDEKVDHPTQKPLSLTSRIVGHFSEHGAVVVVPFAGSGTECVSAVQQGRNFWAAEIKPAYVELARARVEAALAEPALPLEETHERSGWTCQAADLLQQIACGGMLDCHETLTRARSGGTSQYDARWTLSVCRAHHEHIGRHPAEAERVGLLIASER